MLLVASLHALQSELAEEKCRVYTASLPEEFQAGAPASAAPLPVASPLLPASAASAAEAAASSSAEPATATSMPTFFSAAVATSGSSSGTCRVGEGLND